MTVLYTRTEVAELLQVSVWQMGRWVRRGDLAETRFGPRISRISKHELDAFIERNMA